MLSPSELVNYIKFQNQVQVLLDLRQIAYQTIAANSHRSPPSMHSQSNPMNSTKAYRHLQNKLSSHMQASENANYQ